MKQKLHVGPGRPKGTKSSRYVTIQSITAAIQNRLGVTYQEALADLLYKSFLDYESERDLETYPKLMMQLSNKLIEQARQMPEDSESELEDLSDEELLEKQKQAVLAYIKEHGVPNE